MTETILPRRSSQKRNSSKSMPVQLTFHIPQGMKERLEFKNEDEITDELEAIKNAEVLKIVESIRKIEAIKAVENQARLPENTEFETEAILPKAAFKETLKETLEEKLYKNEITSDVYPFLQLQLKNQHMIYSIGASFISDIEKGLKNFAFAMMDQNSLAKTLLVFASHINYSIKKPVLVIVKNFEDPSLDKFRQNFTDGTLWKWKSRDWGNLCFIDYSEIKKCTEDLSKVDLDFICHEFSAVLWEVPARNVQDELQKASLPILGKLDSVTFVISKGETKNKVVKKAAAYFECYGIPLKGVLMSEGEGQL